MNDAQLKDLVQSMDVQPSREMLLSLTTGRMHRLSKGAEDLYNLFGTIIRGGPKKHFDLFGGGDHMAGEEWKKQHDAQGDARAEALAQAEELWHTLQQLAKDLISTPSDILSEV